VKTKDGSVLAQMGWPSMKLPIQYALLYPDRVPNSFKPWDLWDTPSLTFEPPDIETFKSLRLARESVKAGGTMPCVLNAANEYAANAFLRDECGFLQIADVVEEVMSRHTPMPPTLEGILELDTWARQMTADLLKVPTPL
jgi:1-deoxy-D-xylulose-5-phosphate reductoisomerase